MDEGLLSIFSASVNSLHRVQLACAHTAAGRLLFGQAPRLYNFYMPNSTEHEIIMLINVKMTTIVGISTFNSKIDTTSESLKVRKVFSFQRFSFSGQLKFHAQLSMEKFYNLWTWTVSDKTNK